MIIPFFNGLKKIILNRNSLRTARRAIPALLFVHVAHAEMTKIVFVGDSTVANTYGWGDAFSRHLKSDVKCVNLARNGRSSKSYRAEGMWTKVLAEKPQWIFLQFGHNDMKGKGPDRETDPNTTFRENMLRYVEEAQAAGAKPVLVTSLTRRNFENGKVIQDLADYAEAVRKLAAEKNVPLIDLNTLSMNEINALGEQASAIYNPTNASKPDTTHLSPYGEVATANLVANEVRKKIPEFKNLLLEENDTPAFDAIVAADGSAQYTSINDAIAKADNRRSAGKGKPWIIFVKKGEYKERIYVQRERGSIFLIGEDAKNTIVSFNYNANMVGADGKKIGTFATPTFAIDGDGMRIENLTISNTAGRVGQALALRADGDKLVFRQCRFLGYQDTIFVNRGRQLFTDCYIEGDVDFIFGAATCFFNACHIHALGNGYLTAASTPQEVEYGYVFYKCKITAAEKAKVYLGRPWRNFAKTVFFNCELPQEISPQGWHNWDKKDAEQTVFYAEFSNKGKGAEVKERLPWTKQLTSQEAENYTLQKVLAGKDGWMN